MKPVVVRFGLGVAAVAVVAVAIVVATTRHRGDSTVAVAPLSARDRRTLAVAHSLVGSLPKAISQVPQAAADATHGALTPAQAAAVIRRVPALGALSTAIASPVAAVAGLESAYSAVLAGHAPADAESLESDLNQLGTIEGDVVPAIRVVAAGSGHPLNDSQALAAVESDRSTPALAALIADWQQVYGSFVLVEQRAAT